MSSVPASLVVDGVLTSHNIYRFAGLNRRDADLCTGKSSDDFFDIMESTEFLPNCTRSLANGDELIAIQWPSLTRWHAGISCQISIAHAKEFIAADVFSDGFEALTLRPRGSIKDSATKVQYRQILCYELPRGTAIPDNVGIEMDGDNHVCIYPTGENCSISSVVPGGESFVIDALAQLKTSWRLLAMLKLKCDGYNWPAELPPDSKLFPIRRWVRAVVLEGEADLAVSAASSTEVFVAGKICWVAYYKALLGVGSRFWLMCCYEHCLLNRTVMQALRFALNFDKLAGECQCFILKSEEVEEGPAEAQRLAQTCFVDLIAAARYSVHAEGGSAFVAAAASAIHILFVDSYVHSNDGQLIVPFDVRVGNCTVFFDEVDPRPVFESSDNAADVRATSVAPSYGDWFDDAGGNKATATGSLTLDTVSTTALDDGHVVVQIDPTNAFEISLCPAVLSETLHSSTSCFGYTADGGRCKNMCWTKVSGEVSWCHHHSGQVHEFQRFLATAERPGHCQWWEKHFYEKRVMPGRSANI